MTKPLRVKSVSFDIVCPLDGKKPRHKSYRDTRVSWDATKLFVFEPPYDKEAFLIFPLSTITCIRIVPDKAEVMAMAAAKNPEWAAKYENKEEGESNESDDH